MKTYYPTVIGLLLLAISSPAEVSASTGIKVSLSEKPVPDTIMLNEYHLDEITVRSPKEPGRLSELPASVSLISFNRPEYSTVLNLKDLSSLVPNFFMPDYGSKLTSPVYIRGIGSRINSPSIGLYVDNVPYFEKSAFDFDFFEIDRIEILRGPQGTLYGRNTMGGIINVFTKSPLEHQGTKIFLSGGNYSSLATNMAHYRKFSDRFAMSAGINYNNRDGYFMNSHTGEMADNLNSIGVRIRLVHEIDPRSRAEFTSSYERSRQGGYPYAIFSEEMNEAGNVRYNRYSSYDRDMLSNSLYLEHRREGIRFSSTTSHHHTDDLQSVDQDFTPGDLFFVIQDERHSTFSQEVVVRSDHAKDYNWLFGAFGFMQKTDRSLDIEYGDDFLAMQNIPFSMADKRIYDQNTSGAAVFHQSRLTGFPLKNLTLTAGIRLDYENSSLDYLATRFMDNNPNPAGEFESSLNFLEIMPKFALQYGFGSGHSTYLSVAKGYKTGGFNVTFEEDADRIFEPESSWNYELGIKARVMESRAFMNASVFYIDWINQQIYQPVPSGQGSMLKNAGESVSRGAELDIRALPHRNIELQIGYGFTDARFTSHLVTPETDYSGNFIPYVPRHTINTGLKLNITPGMNLVDKLIIYTNYLYTGKHYWNEQNSHYQDGYGILNIKLSFVKRGMQLDLWSRNITDNQYHSFFFQALGNSYIQKSRPMLFGVNFGINF